MSVLNTTKVSLVDAVGNIHNGKMLPVAEVLTNQNPILYDIPWLEANEIFGHRYSVRSGKATGSWRKLNAGVSPTKGIVTPDYEDIAMLEAWSEIDAKLVDASPDPAAYRFQEDVAHAEGMRDTMANVLFNGNQAQAPEQLNGFATRLNSLSSVSKNGRPNVIGASGTGNDTTSIYVVQWGVRRAYAVYPKGSQGGLGMEAFAKTPIDDGSGGLYTAYRTHWTWDMGVIVEDDRCIQRIANIESAGSSNIFDPDDLITAINRMPDDARGAVIYCNSTIKTQMDIQAMDKSNVNYTSSELFGRPVTNFRGIPVRVCDAILDTETAIS